MQTKKWYQSKIVLLSMLLVFVGGSDIFTGWISGQITTDQIDAVAQAYPALKDGLFKSVESKNVFQAIQVLSAFVFAIWRIWFTNTKIGV
jgi:hypothetical protein